MANTKTLLQLRTEARQRADMENSGFIDDSELTSYVNAAYSEWYDLMVLRYEDYFVGPPTSFTIATGQNTSTLPTDFYKLRGVDYSLGGNQFINLSKFNFNQRNQYSDRLASRVSGNRFNRAYRIVGNLLYVLPEQQAAGTYQLWYVPVFTPLVSDTDTVDGFNGWEEYIIVDTCIRMLQKEESDVSVFALQKKNLIQRIENAAQNRDFDGIETVTDTSLQSDNDDWGVY